MTSVRKQEIPQSLVIVGAGPAGLAPLFAAATEGRLQDLLECGVTVLERTDCLGQGSLGEYAIHSDSAAAAFLDILVRSREPRLLALQAHPVAQALATYGTQSAPLETIGHFLSIVGAELCQLVQESTRGEVLTGASVTAVQQMSGGYWQTHFDLSGRSHVVASSSVLLATGAHQPLSRLRHDRVAGLPLLPTYGSKVLQSGHALTDTGLQEISRRLEHRTDPRVTIVGGSTSAAAVALALLTKLSGVTFGEDGITLMHRRPLHIFYETVQQACADGYTSFGPDDVCPLTGRVFRLSGFRLQSRELMMRCLGVAGRPSELRMRLLNLITTRSEETHRHLKESDLIIAAMGYTPRLVPVLDAMGDSLPLWQPTAPQWAVVDQCCRLLASDGKYLPGLFALGLAIGPAASRELGGERHYTGQVNSLWLWQHTLGAKIARQVLQRASAAALRSDLPITHPAPLASSFAIEPSSRQSSSVMAGATL